MKRQGYLFEQICDYGNLYKSYRRAFRGSGKTPETCRFCFHLETELLRLKKEIEGETYQPAPYRYFEIYDPKTRLISVAHFRDRVVHHAVVGALEPLFEPCFIYDSYATRKNKGSHKAILRAQQYLKRYPFYLKMDVDKYFDHIDHRILLELIARKVKDQRFMSLVERIVVNSDISRGQAQGRGLPIGNLTSQFFANVYLDALDHYLKDEFREKAYVRYMDDMVIFSDSRDHLQTVLRNVESFLKERLALRLKPKATLINTRLHGLSFLGYRVFPGLLRVKRENLRRVARRLTARIAAYKRGEIKEEKLAQSAQSWFAFVGFADSLALRRIWAANMESLFSGQALQRAPTG